MGKKADVKKKTRRSSYKYPALESSVNLLTRKDEIEDVKSYSNQIPDEMVETVLADGTIKLMNPREWLNAFVEEEVCSNLTHKGTKINKSKKDKKRIYDKNNARNRCIHTRESAQMKLSHYKKVEDLEKKDD